MLRQVAGPGLDKLKENRLVGKRGSNIKILPILSQQVSRNGIEQVKKERM